MTRRYKNNRYGRYSKSAGQLAAERHIREASALSSELGGTDHDVKTFFFNLSGKDLEAILVEYEHRFGADAASYARDTLPLWRNGSRKMSGMVAERLFSMLPRHMGMQDKLALIESLWNHVSPSSNTVYYCGKKSTPSSISRAVTQRFAEVLSPHSIPDSFLKRFDWLSQGDAQVKQQLLNHFRGLERAMLQDALHQKLPILLHAVFGQNAHKLSISGTERVVIGKHVVQLEFVSYASDLDISTQRPSPPFKFSDYWFLWLVIAVVIVLALNK